jgi:hypothetical protein
VLFRRPAIHQHDRLKRLTSGFLSQYLAQKFMPRMVLVQEYGRLNINLEQWPFNLAVRMWANILRGSASKSVDQTISNFSQTIENARFVRHKQSVSRTMSPQQMFSQNSAAFSTRCRFEVISITTDFEADPFKM